jgi:hypothetical protein
MGEKCAMDGDKGAVYEGRNVNPIS